MVTVVKIGGAVIDREEDLASFLRQFAQLSRPCILVHGGGRRATAVGRQMGLEPQLVDGRRITNRATLEVVTMVYAGLINKHLAALLNAQDCPAIGLSGADLDLIRSHKRPPAPIDFGYVGDIDAVNTQALAKLLSAGMVPVICPLTHDGLGQLLNTNADTIASRLAVALSHKHQVDLRLCFESPGVLERPDDASSALASISQTQFEEMRSRKAIHSGMIPKLQNAFAAAAGGVHQVRVGSFRDLGATGTRIVK